MTPDQISRGKTYRAKKPACVGEGYVNDRQVVYASADSVQYDSPSVSDGRRFPTVTMSKFLEWAGKEIKTDDWTPWDKYLTNT